MASEIIISGFAVDGLAKLRPIFAIIVGMINFDISCLAVIARSSDRHNSGIGGECHRNAQLSVRGISHYWHTLLFPTREGRGGDLGL